MAPASSLGDAMARLDSALAGVSTEQGPECELLDGVRALAEPEPEHGAGLSFAASGRPSPADESRAEQLIDELLASVRHRARIETTRGGRVVASTAVSLGGDIVTSLDPELDAEQRSRHLGDLDTHLREQRERIELLLAVLQMAAKIALAAGSGNPMLALPTALRFIRSVMAERDPTPASPS